MGEHNRITEEKYKSIKNCLKKKKSEFEDLKGLDAYVAHEKKVSESTVRNVRLSADYTAYLERVFRFHRHPAGYKNEQQKTTTPSVARPKHKQVVYKRINGKTLSELKKDDCWRMRASVMWLFFVIGFITFPMVIGGIWLVALLLTGGMPR